MPYKAGHGGGEGGKTLVSILHYIFKCKLLGLTDCHNKSEFFVNHLMNISSSIVGSGGRE